METEYILNELSTTLLANKDEVNLTMSLFVDVLKRSRSIGIKPNVRASKDLKEIELCAGYFVSNWCVDKSVDKERRLYLLGLITKSPLLEGLPKEIEIGKIEVEVRFDGMQGEGLTIAHLTENPILSFNTNEKWRPDELTVQIRTLKVDLSGNCDTVDETRTLINFCTLENLESNIKKVSQLQNKRFSSIEDFWAKKEMIFPHLEFSPTVLANLQLLGHKNPVFVQMADLFSKFNSYCIDWKDGPFMLSKQLPNISSESESTMQAYGKDREFSDNLGNVHICELHARLTPGAQRVHFRPFSERRTIFIGYVGKKLPSTLYPT